MKAKTEGTSVVIENNIPKIIKSMTGKQVKGLYDTIGGMIEAELVDTIQFGDASWAPLSEAWAEVKGHDEPWYYTGRLEGEIKFKTRKDGVDIGIIDAGSYRDGENVATVAHKLEYGSSSDNIPERPLFRTVAEESGEDIVDEAVTWVQKQIKKGKV